MTNESGQGGKEAAGVPQIEVTPDLVLELSRLFAAFETCTLRGLDGDVALAKDAAILAIEVCSRHFRLKAEG